jgi:aminoglycoside phosphotransferase (APT) family kinase protein
VTTLQDYLCAEGLLAGPIAQRHRIGDGHSNVTELVSDGVSSVVVRRPPPPPLHPGAHDVIREARIVSALLGSGVPVPRVLAIEDTGQVLGQPFYVMAHLAGVVIADAAPDSLAAEDVAGALVDTLATLHGVDPLAVGVGDLARPPRDVTAQLRRFARVIDPAGSGLEGELGALMAWLLEDPPAPTRRSILHGDYRLGNVMFAGSSPARIVAVLDWELATVGDPLCDLGYLLATYAVPDEPLHALTEMGRATLAAGWPGRRELAERYARETGIDVSAIGWYEAMALWKLAVLFEYQRRRAAEGIGDDFYARPGCVDGLLAAARRVAEGVPT